MKVCIYRAFVEGPSGGGNQFLKCLKKFLGVEGCVTDNPSDADIILFNSHQDPQQIIQLKKQYLNKKFIHRVDGPIKLYNNMTDSRDDIVYYLNNLLADGTIFQSEYSYESNVKMGMKLNNPFAIIFNACDPDIFFDNTHVEKKDKINLLAASWSNNMRKGFKYYEFLDNNLDFSKYNFSFAGNSPIDFSNIKKLGALNSAQIAEKLRESDVYITASENDPCSNSLIEALTCKTPVLALRSGGHPELLKNDSLLFSDEQELLNKIKYLQDLDNYKKCKDNIEVKNIKEVVSEYISFFEDIVRK